MELGHLCRTLIGAAQQMTGVKVSGALGCGLNVRPPMERFMGSERSLRLSSDFQVIMRVKYLFFISLFIHF